jgi:hypothetical protein
MGRPIRILLQCTIPYAEDDWHVGRFSLLREELGTVAEVVARNLERDGRGDDPVLSSISRSQFDEVWLLGVDGGTALSPRDCAAINAFHKAGGGMMTARDHQDMGLWLRKIEGVGAAHFFHQREYCEPDSSRLCPDDRETSEISWPNYHSGRNGDFQRIIPVAPEHPLLQNPRAPTDRIELFPSHPHEGAVGVPRNEPRARTVAHGKSLASGREFDLIVGFDRTPSAPGRAIAESSFHHFADYNWDLSRGAPSFVTEKPGNGMREEPRALADIRAYVRNAAHWLAPASGA